MPLGPRFRLAAVTTALLLGLLTALSGCGEEPEGPLAKPTSEPSASATSSEEPAATPPAVPDASNDEAGRRAFAKWFVEAFAYAFGTNDPSPITEVAATEKRVRCSTCTAFEDFLAEREEKGVTLQPSTYEVKQIFPTSKVKDVYVYTMLTRRPAYADVAEDGTRTNKNPADKAYPIEVGLRWNDGAYELTGWTAGKGRE